MPRPLSSAYHYIRFSATPPCTDALTVRKLVQDALLQSFGLVSANTYIDVLWLAEDGKELVIRVGKSDASRVMAAVAAFAGPPNLFLVKESPFLPSLLSVNPLS